MPQEHERPLTLEEFLKLIGLLLAVVTLTLSAVGLMVLIAGA